MNEYRVTVEFSIRVKARTEDEAEMLAAQEFEKRGGKLIAGPYSVTMEQLEEEK